MPVYYASTDANKLAEIRTDNESANLLKMTIYPTAENPDKLPPKSPGGVSTQWIVQHPHMPNIWITMTSFWNKRPAMLTIFQQTEDGLNKMTVEGSTGGREAVHAVFAPTAADEDKVTLAIAHHNDGFVSFFQFPTKGMPESLMDQPTLTLELPALNESKKNMLPANMKRHGLSVPSSHHVFYAPSGKWVMVVDPNQAVIFTYTCDPKTGLPSSENPTFAFECHTDAPALGWFSGVVGKIAGLGCRPRRVATSPNGKYLFVSYETRNVVQSYHLKDETGQIDPDNKGLLQENSTLTPALTKQPFIGFAVQATAEMMVVNNSLYCSNRGGILVKGLGNSESSICVMEIRDGGRLSSPKVVECSGPVRHFCVYTKGDHEYLVAGTCSKTEGSLQTFRRPKAVEGAVFESVGQAEVGVDVFCVLPASIE